MNAKNTKATRTCHALLDDEKELLRECGAPATVCVTVRCLVAGEKYGILIDKYYNCDACAPEHDPTVGITVEPIEEVGR